MCAITVTAKPLRYEAFFFDSNTSLSSMPSWMARFFPRLVILRSQNVLVYTMVGKELTIQPDHWIILKSPSAIKKLKDKAFRQQYFVPPEEVCSQTLNEETLLAALTRIGNSGDNAHLARTLLQAISAEANRK